MSPGKFGDPQDVAAAAPITDDRQPYSQEIEVTARLVEVPEGAIRNDPLYRYATVLQYEVLRSNGVVGPGTTIFVAHYRPQFPRAQAGDRFRTDVHGSLEFFLAGQIHRMVLVADAEQRFVGGVVNSYPDATGIFWAIRTDLSQVAPVGDGAHSTPSP